MKFRHPLSPEAQALEALGRVVNNERVAWWRRVARWMRLPWSAP